MDIDTGALYISVVMVFVLGVLTATAFRYLYKKMQEINVKTAIILKTQEKRIESLEKRIK